MKTRLLIIILFFAGTLNAHDTGEHTASPVSYGIELPNWISQKGYIGISDPIKDTIISYNQAVNRALFLYALNNGGKLSSVYEYYYLNSDINNKTQDNQKSHWIAEFETSLKDISYKVKRTYRTKYNETIVLLSVIENDKNSLSFDPIIEDVNFNVGGSFMYHYEYLDKKNEYGEKQLLKITSTDSIKSMNWSSTISGSEYTKISSADDVIFSLKKINTIYNDYGKCTDDIPFAKIEYGLWDSLIDTFFQALSLFEPNSVVVENTTRQITKENNGTYNDKNQNISRLVMKTNISCSLMNIYIKNNNLYTRWNITER